MTLRNHKQDCKDCDGTGDDWIDYNCPTCRGAGSVSRIGPYRLSNGTWSDGIDRTKSISNQSGSECDQNRIYVWKYLYENKWVAERADPFLDEEFDTWEEAIACADRMC